MYDPVRFAAYQERRLAEYVPDEEYNIPNPRKNYLLHDEAGFSALAAGIINQAIKDLGRIRRGEVNTEQVWISNALGFTPEEDLEDYFWSAEFDIHCHMLKISPDKVRKMLELEPAN